MIDDDAPPPADPAAADPAPKDPTAADPMAAALPPEEQASVLAAELAIGLLDDDEARAAGARLASDPAFADEVARWQEHLAVLAAGLTPIMAPARARQGIREKLGHAHAPLSDAAAGRAGARWRWPLVVILVVGAVAAAALLWSPA